MTMNSYFKIWGLAEDEKGKLDYGYIKANAKLTVEQISKLLGYNSEEVIEVTEEEYEEETGSDE